MDYSSLDIYYTFYDTLIRNAAFTYSLALSKAILSLLLVLQYARMYFKSAHSGTEGHSISLYELFRPFLLITVIISYSYIMDAFDDIARTAESYVYSSFQEGASLEKILSVANRTGDGSREPDSDISLLGETALRIAEIANLLQHPSLLIIKVTQAFTSFVDYSIFTLAILIRFGSLFVLRFLGPIVLGLSVYERFASWWIKWITAYGLLYLWIICIFLVNFFAASIAMGVYKILVSTGTPEAVTGLSMTTTLFVLVAVKCHFYFRSRVLLQRIFQ